MFEDLLVQSEEEKQADSEKPVASSGVRSWNLRKRLAEKVGFVESVGKYLGAKRDYYTWGGRRAMEGLFGEAEAGSIKAEIFDKLALPTTIALGSPGGSALLSDLWKSIDSYERSKRIRAGSVSKEDYDKQVEIEVDRRRTREFWGGVAETVLPSMEFMTEMGLANFFLNGLVGGGNVGTPGVKGTLKELLVIDPFSPKALKSVSTAKLWGAAAVRTPLMTSMLPHRLIAEMFRRMTPEFDLSEKDDAEFMLSLRKLGDAPDKAFSTAAKDSAIEVFSEMAGGPTLKMLAPVARAVGARIPFNAAAIRAWHYLDKQANKWPKLRQLLAESGYSGVPGEMLEEQIGQAMRRASGVITDEEAAGQPLGGYLITNPRELLTQATAFSIPGLSVFTAQLAAGKIESEEYVARAMKQRAEMARRGEAVSSRRESTKLGEEVLSRMDEDAKQGWWNWLPFVRSFITDRPTIEDVLEHSNYKGLRLIRARGTELGKPKSQIAGEIGAYLDRINGILTVETDQDAAALRRGVAADDVVPTRREDDQGRVGHLVVRGTQRPLVGVRESAFLSDKDLREIAERNGMPVISPIIGSNEADVGDLTPKVKELSDPAKAGRVFHLTGKVEAAATGERLAGVMATGKMKRLGAKVRLAVTGYREGTRQEFLTGTQGEYDPIGSQPIRKNKAGEDVFLLYQGGVNKGKTMWVTPFSDEGAIVEESFEIAIKAHNREEGRGERDLSGPLADLAKAIKGSLTKRLNAASASGKKEAVRVYRQALSLGSFETVSKFYRFGMRGWKSEGWKNLWNKELADEATIGLAEKHLQGILEDLWDVHTPAGSQVGQPAAAAATSQGKQTGSALASPAVGQKPPPIPGAAPSQAQSQKAPPPPQGPLPRLPKKTVADSLRSLRKLLGEDAEFDPSFELEHVEWLGTFESISRSPGQRPQKAGKAREGADNLPETEWETQKRAGHGKVWRKTKWIAQYFEAFGDRQDLSNLVSESKSILEQIEAATEQTDALESRLDELYSEAVRRVASSSQTPGTLPFPASFEYVDKLPESDFEPEERLSAEAGDDPPFGSWRTMRHEFRTLAGDLPFVIERWEAGEPWSVDFLYPTENGETIASLISAAGPVPTGAEIKSAIATLVQERSGHLKAASDLAFERYYLSRQVGEQKRLAGVEGRERRTQEGGTVRAELEVPYPEIDSFAAGADEYTARLSRPPMTLRDQSTALGFIRSAEKFWRTLFGIRTASDEERRPESEKKRQNFWRRVSAVIPKTLENLADDIVSNRFSLLKRGGTKEAPTEKTISMEREKILEDFIEQAIDELMLEAREKLQALEKKPRQAPPTAIGAAGEGSTWRYARFAPGGYEVSSQGDRRFSALDARLKDGRTIEEAYQLDVKGYRAKSNDWRSGKGKPPINGKTDEQIWEEYKGLWRKFLTENPNLESDLRVKAAGKTLTDKFASTPVSQARALAELLTETSQETSAAPSPGYTEWTKPGEADTEGEVSYEMEQVADLIPRSMQLAKDLEERLKKRSMPGPIPDSFGEQRINDFATIAEVVEEWKAANNIVYDPQEAYARGEGFFHDIGAFNHEAPGLFGKIRKVLLAQERKLRKGDKRWWQDPANQLIVSGYTQRAKPSVYFRYRIPGGGTYSSDYMTREEAEASRVSIVASRKLELHRTIDDWKAQAIALRADPANSKSQFVRDRHSRDAGILDTAIAEKEAQLRALDSAKIVVEEHSFNKGIRPGSGLRLVIRPSWADIVWAAVGDVYSGTVKQTTGKPIEVGNFSLNHALYEVFPSPNGMHDYYRNGNERIDYATYKQALEEYNRTLGAPRVDPKAPQADKLSLLAHSIAASIEGRRSLDYNELGIRLRLGNFYVEGPNESDDPTANMTDADWLEATGALEDKDASGGIRPEPGMREIARELRRLNDLLKKAFVRVHGSLDAVAPYEPKQIKRAGYVDETTFSLGVAEVSEAGRVTLKFNWRQRLLSHPKRRLYDAGTWDLPKMLMEAGLPKDEQQMLLDYAAGKPKDLDALVNGFEAQLPKLEMEEVPEKPHPVLTIEGQAQIKAGEKVDVPTYRVLRFKLPFAVPGQHAAAPGLDSNDYQAGWFRMTEEVDPVTEERIAKSQEIQSELFQKNKGGFPARAVKPGPTEAEIAQRSERMFEAIRDRYPPEISDATVMMDVRQQVIRQIEEERDISDWKEMAYGYLPEQAAFLNLMLKDQTWVPVFVNAITQWARQQGFTKVRFPTGETAAMVQGHQVLADQLAALTKEKEAIFIGPEGEMPEAFNALLNGIRFRFIRDGEQWKRIVLNAETGEETQDVVIVPESEVRSAWKQPSRFSGLVNALAEANFLRDPTQFLTENDLRQQRLREIDAQIAELKTEGIEKLAPIEAFYEKRVASIVNRMGAQLVTDANGNTWREVPVQLEGTFDLGMADEALADLTQRYKQNPDSLSQEERDFMTRRLAGMVEADDRQKRRLSPADAEAMALLKELLDMPRSVIRDHLLQALKQYEGSIFQPNVPGIGPNVWIQKRGQEPIERPAVYQPPQGWIEAERRGARDARELEAQRRQMEGETAEGEPIDNEEVAEGQDEEAGIAGEAAEDAESIEQGVLTQPDAPGEKETDRLRAEEGGADYADRIIGSSTPSRDARAEAPGVEKSDFHRTALRDDGAHDPAVPLLNQLSSIVATGQQAVKDVAAALVRLSKTKNASVLIDGDSFTFPMKEEQEKQAVSSVSHVQKVRESLGATDPDGVIVIWGPFGQKSTTAYGLGLLMERIVNWAWSGRWATGPYKGKWIKKKLKETEQAKDALGAETAGKEISVLQLNLASLQSALNYDMVSGDLSYDRDDPEAPYRAVLVFSEHELEDMSQEEIGDRVRKFVSDNQVRTLLLGSLGRTDEPFGQLVKEKFGQALQDALGVSERDAAQIRGLKSPAERTARALVHRNEAVGNQDLDPAPDVVYASRSRGEFLLLQAGGDGLIKGATRISREGARTDIPISDLGYKTISEAAKAINEDLHSGNLQPTAISFAEEPGPHVILHEVTVHHNAYLFVSDGDKIVFSDPRLHLFDSRLSYVSTIEQLRAAVDQLDGTIRSTKAKGKETSLIIGRKTLRESVSLAVEKAAMAKRSELKAEAFAKEHPITLSRVISTGYTALERKATTFLKGKALPWKYSSTISSTGGVVGMDLRSAYNAVRPELLRQGYRGVQPAYRGEGDEETRPTQAIRRVVESSDLVLFFGSTEAEGESEWRFKHAKRFADFAGVKLLVNPSRKEVERALRMKNVQSGVKRVDVVGVIGSSLQAGDKEANLAATAFGFDLPSSYSEESDGFGEVTYDLGAAEEWVTRKDWIETLRGAMKTWASKVGLPPDIGESRADELLERLFSPSEDVRHAGVQELKGFIDRKSPDFKNYLNLVRQAAIIARMVGAPNRGRKTSTATPRAVASPSAPASVSPQAPPTSPPGPGPIPQSETAHRLMGLLEESAVWLLKEMEFGSEGVFTAMRRTIREKRAEVNRARTIAVDLRRSLGLPDSAKVRPKTPKEAKSAAFLNDLRFIADGSDFTITRTMERQEYEDQINSGVPLPVPVNLSSNDPFVFWGRPVAEVKAEWDSWAVQNKLPKADELVTMAREFYDRQREHFNDILSVFGESETMGYVLDYVQHVFAGRRPREMAFWFIDETNRTKGRRLPTFEAVARWHGALPKAGGIDEYLVSYTISVTRAAAHRYVMGVSALTMGPEGVPECLPIPADVEAAPAVPEQTLELALKRMVALSMGVLQERLVGVLLRAKGQSLRERIRAVSEVLLASGEYDTAPSPFRAYSGILLRRGDTQRVFRNVFHRGDAPTTDRGRMLTRFFNGVQTFNAWNKYMTIGLSAFHPFSLVESVAAAYGVDKANPIFRPLDAYKQGLAMMKRFKNDPDAYIEWRKSGLFSGVSNPDLEIGRVERSIEKAMPVLRQYHLGALATSLDAFKKAKRTLDGLLWDNFQPALKLMTAEFILSRWVDSLSSRGVAFDMAELREDISKHVNNAFGGQDWLDYLWASPKALRVLHLLVFAPDWSLSVANVSGITSLPVLRNIFEPNLSLIAKSEMKSRYWPAMLLIVMQGLPNVMQAIIYGAFGDPDEGDVPFCFLNETGQKSYIDVTPIARKLGWIPWLGYSGEYSGKRRLYWRWGKQAYEIWEGWGLDAGGMGVRKLSGSVRLAWELSTGTSTGSGGFQLPFKGQGLAGWLMADNSFFKGRLGHVAKQFIPFWATSAITGQPYSVFAQAKRGASINKIVERMTGAVDKYAEERIGLPTLKEQLAESSRDATRNGYNARMIYTLAKSRATSRYSYGMFRAINDGKKSEALRNMRALARLGKNWKNIRSSARTRGEMVPYGGYWSEDDWGQAAELWYRAQRSEDRD